MKTSAFVLELHAVLLCCACESGEGQTRPRTVPGPESSAASLGVRGWVVMDRPIGGIIAVNVATGEEIVVRAPGKDIGTVHALSGPDREGRIAFVEDHQAAKRHGIKWIRLDGSGERLVLEREGDALWFHDGEEIGDHLALAPVGGRVAFVRDLATVSIPSADLRATRGFLTVLDMESGQASSPEVTASDEQPCWFPDGLRIAYTDWIEPAAADTLRSGLGAPEAFAASWLDWERIQAVHVLDTRSGETEAVCIGWRGVVAPDGTRILVTDLDQHWRLFELESRTWRPVPSPGAVDQGPIAWLDAQRMLYWALPTEGAILSTTRNNSPFVGPKPMLTLKSLDVEAGGFATLVPSLDPRRTVSFGIAE